MTLKKVFIFFRFTTLKVSLRLYPPTKMINLNRRINPFLQNLASEINNISKISITGRDLNMLLIKYKNKFMNPSGYPFKDGVWESFITSLSLLRVEKKRKQITQRD